MHDEMKSRDRLTGNQKQFQSERLDRHIQDNKRMLQSSLATDYGNASRMKQKDQYNDKTNNINTDRASLDRTMNEMNFINSNEAKKKQYVQQMYTNQKKLYDISQENEKKKQMELLREDKNSINNSIKDSYDREAIYKGRYMKFNNVQDQAAQQYAKNVLSLENEKRSKIDGIVKKQVDERNKKMENLERNKRTFQDNWNQNTKNTIVNQMNHSVDVQNDEKYKHEHERQERYAKQDAIDHADQMERNHRKSLQSNYKEMLDNQRKIKSEYKGYGNMSNVEKAINRNDLLAWKNFDYTTYALVPGFNSNTLNLGTKVHENKVNKPKIRDLDKEASKLKIYNTNLNNIKNEFAGTDYYPTSNDYEMHQTKTPSHRRHTSMRDYNNEPNRQGGGQSRVGNMSLDNIKPGLESI
jgi:hypothetical protein